MRPLHLRRTKKGEGPGGRALHVRVAGEEWHGCGCVCRVGGRCIGDGSEVVSHLREDWNGWKGRGPDVGLVLADGKAQAEVSLTLGGQVCFAYGYRVDVPDRAVGLLDGAQRHHQGVDKLLEDVVIM